jgi:UDP-N-acetylglucosamine diphosphorylase/glucosamine-1-phosphate N-acetyltransferase
MNICIFEDFFIPLLAPLNNLRQTSNLVCGALTLREKILNYIPGKVNLTLHSRKYIADYCREKFPKAAVNNLSDGEYIYLNSRVLFSEAGLKEIIKRFKKEKKSAITQGKAVIAFNTTPDKTAQFREIINDETDNLISYADIEWLGLDKIETTDYRLIDYPSDLILYHEEEIKHDLKILLKGRKKLHISKKATVNKNVAFDTSNGGIYIDKNTIIEPFTYIKGPVYIGENCIIRSGTKLYGPVRTGNWCKVSGEITHSILHDCVNKQHLGFLGHSYLAEWVNLGAGTTTSNPRTTHQLRLR